MPPARLESLLGAATAFRRWDLRSDAELLARFMDQRDETAFEVLLVRHTPAVRAACQGWLRSTADIDDAAQATFLVLVQRARSIRNRAALGPWLYGVAANVARRLRQRRPTLLAAPLDVPGRELAGDGELRELLAEEVGRLPEKYRLPVQLCYWAGLSTAEAAQRLGWPKGTVLTRLAWARKRLQKCLTGRGVSPVVLVGLAATAAPAVSGQWVRTTARAAKGLLDGEPMAKIGVSERTIVLTEGVVRAMFHDKMKHLVLAALLIVGLAGFGIFQWVAASDGPGKESKLHPDAAGNKEVAKGDEAKLGPTGRRREAVIRLPVGAFVKEVDAAPYGNGRLTWTYEEERVVGRLEGSVMGGEFDVSIETEHSLSSSGTIYGLITAFRINHLRLPDSHQFAELKPYLGLWSLVEPLINDVMIDLPFSYQFRVQSDRLVISNFRMLLAGPNPFGKLGGVVAGNGGNKEALMVLAYFQALGTAIEGNYTVSDGKEKPAPNKRPVFPKPRGQGESKPINSYLRSTN
jgi:RNA polymerase sigma factor (sigma-70 family)